MVKPAKKRSPIPAPPKPGPLQAPANPPHNRLRQAAHRWQRSKRYGWDSR